MQQGILLLSSRGSPEAWGLFVGAPEALWGKRGCTDARKTCSTGETVVLRGCMEDLFPGRDCSVARLRGRSVPRERLHRL